MRANFSIQCICVSQCASVKNSTRFLLYLDKELRENTCGYIFDMAFIYL